MGPFGILTMLEQRERRAERGRPWSDAEVLAAVEDYFDMLKMELAGREYNKTEHRHRLMLKLDGRSDGSVERKHQNISAVLQEMGLPFISGYKPLKNLQGALRPVVERHVIEAEVSKK